MSLMNKLMGKGPRTTQDIVGTLSTMVSNLTSMVEQRESEIKQIDGDLSSEESRHAKAIAEENMTHEENVGTLNSAKSAHQAEIDAAQNWVNFLSGKGAAPGIEIQTEKTEAPVEESDAETAS